MTILDRYIAKQYLLNIGVLLVLLFSFVVAVDASLNIQRYLELAQRELQARGETDISAVRRVIVAVLFVLDLWWPRLLQLFNYLNGLVLIAAMGFTYAQLVRQREVVAVLAGGISLFRLTRPVMLVAMIMLGVQTINQEFVIPQIAPLLLRDNREITRRDFSTFPVLPTPDSQGRLWSAASFDPNTGTLKGVNVWDRDADGRATKRTSAATAVYDEAGRKWVLKSATINALAVVGSAGGAGSGGIVVAPDAALPAGEVRFQSDLDPTALKVNHYRIFSQSLSLAQLIEAATSPVIKPEVRESFLRLAWGRGAMIPCVLLSLLVSIPYFLTREPRNMVLQSLKCAPVAIGSVLGSTLGTAAAIPGLPVQLAVFLPVLVLVPIAIASVTSIKT